MAKFKNKNVIVTGGGRGIGRAVALSFAREGANVCVTARTDTELAEVREEIASLAVRGIKYACDVSDREGVRRMVEFTLGEFGSVDILINNAGAFVLKEFKDLAIEEWKRIIDVNLNGVFYCTHYVIPGMIEQGEGTIINISSMAGKKFYLKQTPYVAAKFGVVGFSKTLAAELKSHNIKVHVICPGGVDTRLTKDHGFAPGSAIKPQEIADIVLFLAGMRKEITIDEVMVRRSIRDPF